jgi:hypothetical protein
VPHPHAAVLARYHAAGLGRIEDLANERRVGRHRLDPVDGLGDV